MSTIQEAREYDVYGHPYTEDQDCTFLTQAFQTYHGNIREVLDLACGTGRHALRLARDGYTVTGVDIDEGMLAVASEKAAEWGVCVEWVQANMLDIEYAAQFDAAYILFNTMMGLTTNDELVRLWERAYATLRPGGLFIIEVGNYWALLANGELKLGTSCWEQEEGGRKVVRDTTVLISSVNNLLGRHTYQTIWRSGGEEETKEWNGSMRILSLNELDLLARLLRFEIVGTFGAMDMSQPISDPQQTAHLDNPPRSYVLVLKK